MPVCLHEIQNPTIRYGEMGIQQKPTNVVIDGIEYQVTFTGQQRFISGLCSLCGATIENLPDGFDITEGTTTLTPVNQ
ncbi:MAG TPA: hypothetical protein PKU78_04790 [Candidatus Dojkabacteria bacterium]|nr:hypothetical protein [Candidatus Dojkabacteria bacterium]HRO65510.1 hypothetical protein [Candidatus Dojkabacteria bacterium]HRP51352.1 hypothetical protein [Candidatus Dojkabacteria bacterium]